MASRTLTKLMESGATPSRSKPRKNPSAEKSQCPGITPLPGLQVRIPRQVDLQVARRAQLGHEIQDSREIARGICFLHEECSTRVLHLAINPQNTLLAENFGVKIADVGLSRWRMMKVSDKLDVYSFALCWKWLPDYKLSIPVCLAGGAQSSWRHEKLRSGKLMEMLEEEEGAAGNGGYL
ncbi:hypothetical protein SELMODRAFT_404295 [Selaginella moellendorffii]|uniref:Protein kinase domain-containing protein n=1 Tax=Selaginella moellendorffii TaxID=88036 RepID=D8QUW2_SELML|nr:hypothetical protein SELMODRAFT_404295 [Selaginella moellendorffii]